MDLLQEGAIEEILDGATPPANRYIQDVMERTIEEIDRLARTELGYVEERLAGAAAIDASAQVAYDGIRKTAIDSGRTIIDQTMEDIAPFYESLPESERALILDTYRQELEEEVKKIAEEYAEAVFSFKLITPDGRRRDGRGFFIAVSALALTVVREYRMRSGIDSTQKLSEETSKIYKQDMARRLSHSITTGAAIKHDGDWYSPRTYYRSNLVYDMVGVARQAYNKVIDAGEGGVIISAHMYPAPDHAPFQGKAFSMSRYRSINDALARHFMTCNCKHIVKPVSRSEYLEARKDNGDADGLAARAQEKVTITTKSGEVKRLSRYDAVQYARSCDRLSEDYERQADTFSKLDDFQAENRCTRQALSYSRLSNSIMDIVKE